MNIYQWSGAVCCGIGSVESRLSVWMRVGPGELIFDQMCFGFNSAAAFFCPLLYLHRNHLRWVNFRGQPTCETLQSLFVRPGWSGYVCVCLSTMHACVLSSVRLPSCAVTRAARVKAALCGDERPDSLSPTHTNTHTYTHTHQILTIPFYTRLWRGAFWWQSIAQTTALCQYLDSTVVL